MKRFLRFTWFAALLCVWLAGCVKEISTEEPFNPPPFPGNDGRIPATFRMSATNLSPAEGGVSAADGESFDAVDAYVFAGGTLNKVSKAIPVSGGQCTLEVLPGAEVCFTANLAAAPAVTEGTTKLDEFLAMRNAALDTEGDYRPAEFFSGRCTVPAAVTAPVAVSLWRSIAQLNLNTSADENLTVERIEIEGLPLSTTLMRGENPAAPAATRSLTLDWSAAPKTTEENILRLYETSSTVRFTVHALYRGEPQVVRLALDKVERNYFYTIRLSKVESTVTGTFTIVPWQDGGDVGADPDRSQAIVLDEALSTLPEGVALEGENLLRVSEQGGAITLAFLADAPLDVTMEGAGNEATLSPLGAETEGEQVVSRFALDVKAQGNGRLGYRIGLNVKRKAHQFCYDRFAVEVAASRNQIETVTLGGVEWMAFNSLSGSLDGQIYLLDGMSVEEMYRKAWPQTMGNMFQWGLLYGYSPCKPGTPNAGNQERADPLVWEAPTHVPCPEGYRLPTKAEMWALLPPGTPVPGSYTYNGETITTALRVADEEYISIDGVSGRARYLELRSSAGGVMYIPLGGNKGANSTSNNPSFGQGFMLWTNQDGGNSTSANVSYFWPGNNETGSISGNQNERYSKDGFGYVRCIKVK